MSDENRFNFTATADSTPEEVLRQSRQLRFDMLHGMCKDGMPEGRSIRQVMDLLNDVDNQVLASQKLEQEKTLADNENEIARMAIEVQKATGVAITDSRVINGEYKEVSVQELPEVELLPGEMSTDIADINYEDFIAEHGDSE